MYFKLCGEFSYEAIGFNGKKLDKFEIDWFNNTGYPGCKIGRFRGYAKVTFTLNSTAKMFEASVDPWLATKMLKYAAYGVLTFMAIIYIGKMKAFRLLEKLFKCCTNHSKKVKCLRCGEEYYETSNMIGSCRPKGESN